MKDLHVKDALRSYLFRRYGSYCDKPGQDSLTHRPFRVDELGTARAVGVTGVYVTVEDEHVDAFVLELFGFPTHPSVLQVVEGYSGRSDSPSIAHISMTLTARQHLVLREMARAFRRARQERQPLWDTSNRAAWEHAAKALDGLAHIMGGFCTLTTRGTQRDSLHKPNGPSNAPWPIIT